MSGALGPKVWGLLLICLAAVVYLLSHLPVSSLPPASWLFLVGAIWLEAAAVRLPGAGASSYSCAFLLAMAWLPVAPAFPALVACLITWARVVQHGYPELRLRWLEGLTDLAPLLLSLAACDGLARLDVRAQPLQVQVVLGSLLYCLLQLEAQSLLAGELAAAQRQRYKRLQLEFLAIRLTACCCAALLVLASQHGLMATLLCWPLLFMLVKLTRRMVAAEESEQRRNVMRQLDASQQRLEDASVAQQQLKINLDRSVDDVRILEAASRTLLQVRNCQQTSDEIVALCASLVNASTIAVFLAYEGRLYPRSCQSVSLLERLKGAPLTGLVEPVLEQAWRSGALQHQPSGAEEQRIFAGEAAVLVLPLGSAGVLYVGRAAPAFSELEGRRLIQAAGQGALALQIATHLEALEVAYRHQAVVSDQLQQWAGILDRLLSSSLGFLDKLDRAVFLNRLSLSAASLFPHDSLEVHLDGATGPLAEHICNTRLPLLLEDVEVGRFPPLRAGERSLLCVPIVHPDLQKVGFIAMGARPAAAFTRWQQDSLTLLGTLAAVAWKNLELHAETVAAHAQLIQSGKMAAVGQLAAGVAHEMNTPLGSIKLNVDAAARTMTNDPVHAQERLSKAKDMIERTRQIVEKLLYYSRQSEHGRVATDLSALVEDTLQLVGHSLTLDKVKVSRQLGQVRPVLTNQNEMQQVLCNLLLNARDAVLDLPEPRRELLITTGERDGRAFFRVTDQGAGIEPTILSRITEPFFTTKEVGKGTGLGLSISQQIIQSHGGELAISSIPGQGSEFTVFLSNCS